MSSICDTTTCSPCDPYDNCGCVNPTTFECVTVPGVCEAAGITDDMNGKQVVEALCTTIEDIQTNEGKVLIDGDDTCPGYLFPKLEEGLNITLTQTGTGCNRKIVINASEGGVPVDVNAKVTTNDTTSGYLNDKIATGDFLTKNILSPAGNEKLEIDVVPATLISTDAGNQLTLGVDGKFKTLYSAPDGSETKILQGGGVTVTGQGTTLDPYIVSTNPSIVATRACFDGIWRAITLVATGNPDVIYLSGTPQYRYRFDGSIEFKGAITFQVNFSDYTLSNRKFNITMGNIPSTCLTLGEQAGLIDLKSINYIDPPQVGVDQLTQIYGYIIRKSTQNIQLEFQSSFLGATTKTIVVNFDGAVHHPNI